MNKNGIKDKGDIIADERVKNMCKIVDREVVTD